MSFFCRIIIGSITILVAVVKILVRFVRIRLGRGKRSMELVRIFVEFVRIFYCMC